MTKKKISKKDEVVKLNTSFEELMKMSTTYVPKDSIVNKIKKTAKKK